MCLADGLRRFCSDGGSSTTHSEALGRLSDDDVSNETYPEALGRLDHRETFLLAPLRGLRLTRSRSLRSRDSRGPAALLASLRCLRVRGSSTRPRPSSPPGEGRSGGVWRRVGPVRAIRFAALGACRPSQRGSRSLRSLTVRFAHGSLRSPFASRVSLRSDPRTAHRSRTRGSRSLRSRVARLAAHVVRRSTVRDAHSVRVALPLPARIIEVLARYAHSEPRARSDPRIRFEPRVARHRPFRACGSLRSRSLAVPGIWLAASIKRAFGPCGAVAPRDAKAA